MKLRDLPIVRKLTLILAINVALAVLLITLVFTVSELLKEYRDTREQAQTLAAIIATNSQAALAFGDAASARETLASLQAQPLVMAARLYDGAGQPFAEYSSAYLAGAHASGSLHAFVDAFLPVDMPIVQAMPETDGRLDNVHEILKAGGHLVAMVNEILDLARIETGRIELRTETLAIAPLAEACLAQLGPLARVRHIAIATDLAAAPPVRADALRLRQVLLNLLSNAIKYNRDHGRIDLSARAEQDRLRVEVADSGRGIAPEQMARLFKPFERIETSYDGIGGTGIGLALVKRLVEAMDGEVGVTSIPGSGSTFWFSLPLAPSS